MNILLHFILVTYLTCLLPLYPCDKWVTVTTIVRVMKSRRMRWAEHVARMGEMRGVYRVLVGKPEGKRPLGRSSRRWDDNIKIGIQEV
jgi:hypothetical protein